MSTSAALGTLADAMLAAVEVRLQSEVVAINNLNPQRHISIIEKEHLRNGDIFPHAERNLIDLGYEDGGDADEQGRAVHIDSGANGQNKPRHPRVHFHFLVHASEGDGKSRGPAHASHISLERAVAGLL